MHICNRNLLAVLSCGNLKISFLFKHACAPAKGRSPTCNCHQTHTHHFLLHPGHNSDLIYIASGDGQRSLRAINDTCLRQIAHSFHFFSPLLVRQNACLSQSPQGMLLPFAVKNGHQPNDLSWLPNPDARMADKAQRGIFLDSEPPLSKDSFVSSFNRPNVLKLSPPLECTHVLRISPNKTTTKRDRLYIVPIVVNACRFSL